jgi:pimeloyl-ACP methyl ester carboxylesterase
MQKNYTPLARKFGIGIGVIISLWIVASLILLAASNSFVYKMDKSKGIKPDGVNYNQEYVQNKAGQKIDLWWIPKAQSQSAILYLHGNWGRLPHFFPELSKSASVLAPSYPGFSESEGSPTTENIYEAAELSLEYLHSKGFKDEQITVWGHSLGGSPAVYLSTRHPGLKKVVLVGTFSSVQSMCLEKYSILCVFGGGILNSERIAPMAKTKIRQYHVKDDLVVPFREGEKLFQKLGSSDKKFEVIAGEHSYFDIQNTLKDD